MDCPCCDGLGMIDDPQCEGRIKKCPECDTPPSPYFLPLSAWLDPLDKEDKIAFEADVEKYEKKRRDEDAIVAAHAAVAGPDCHCSWCIVQMKEE